MPRTRLLVLAANSLSSDVARLGTSSVTMLESSAGLYASQYSLSSLDGQTLVL